MFRILSGILILAFSACSCATPDRVASERAQELAQSLLIVDTHIDVPYRLEGNYADVTRATSGGDFDYPRARSGGLNIPFMSIYIPASYEDDGGSVALADRLIDRVEAMVGRAPGKFAIPYSVQQARAQAERGLISLAMGMENGTPLEGKLENLAYFHGRGIRYITLTHSRSNHISDSSYDKTKRWKGLSPFGRELVPAMNAIGMMIDVSHLSDDAFYQVIELSKAPVIASHSSARVFTPGMERNMGDDMIKALAAAGGVVQINFGSGFISADALAWDNTFRPLVTSFITEKKLSYSSPEVLDFIREYRRKNPYPFASLDDVLDHFDHVVALSGVDYVGIGSDYDGVGDSLPVGLKDVAAYPALIDGLLTRGYSESDIKKILGGNLLRVWSAVEDYAARQATAASGA
jgi:membrane dipeptidase